MDITLRYGPYLWNGILRHRIERLYGLINRLEELKYKVILKPYHIWDDLEITMHDVKVFKCRLTVLRYNCPWDRDPLCRNALEAIQEAESKVRAVMSRATHEVEEQKVALSPAEYLLEELVWDLPLPLTPAEEVLSVFLKTVLNVEFAREVVDQAIARTAEFDAIVRLARAALMPSDVYKHRPPEACPSSTRLASAHVLPIIEKALPTVHLPPPPSAPPVLPSPAASSTPSAATTVSSTVSSTTLETPTSSVEWTTLLWEEVQKLVERTLDTLPDNEFLKETLSVLMTRTLLEVTTKRRSTLQDQITASKMLLDHFERALRLKEDTQLAYKFVVTTLVGNVPIRHDGIPEENVAF